MDLSQFDTREKAHDGVEVDLVINGETILGEEDGEPVRFTIKGVADPDVHRLILAQRRATASTPDEVLAADLKLARVAVLGWSDNFTLAGEAIPFSRKAIDKVFALPLVRRAILAEVMNEARFTNGPSEKP